MATDKTEQSGHRGAGKGVSVVAVLGLLASILTVASATAVEAQTLRCGGRVATIIGTSGADRLVGTPGPDVIVGLGGADVIVGRGGNDRICAGSGADTVRAGGGHDRVWGGGGDDRILGQGGRDVLLGGGGQDFLYGGGRGDQLLGGTGLDSLLGGAGADVGRGGGGADACSTERSVSCEVGYVTGVDAATAFVQRAVAGRPVVQLFSGTALSFRSGNTESVPSVRPGPDPRPDARRAQRYLDRYESGRYLLSVPTRDCAEYNGGDLGYICSLRVIQDGVGYSDIDMSMNFGGQINGWSVREEVRACSRGATTSVAIVAEGQPVSCRVALRVTDRYFNDPSVDKQGSGAFAFVDGWSCSSNSGTVAFYSGVGGSCANDTPGAELIFCEPDFEPQPNIRPWAYDTRATQCELVL